MDGFVESWWMPPNRTATTLITPDDDNLSPSSWMSSRASGNNNDRIFNGNALPDMKVSASHDLEAESSRRAQRHRGRKPLLYPTMSQVDYSPRWWCEAAYYLHTTRKSLSPGPCEMSTTPWLSARAEVMQRWRIEISTMFPRSLFDQDGWWCSATKGWITTRSMHVFSRYSSPLDSSIVCILPRTYELWYILLSNARFIFQFPYPIIPTISAIDLARQFLLIIYLCFRWISSTKSMDNNWERKAATA